MSILDIKQKSNNCMDRKTICVFIAISFTMIAVNKIYAIFGHGVSSNAMTWMFLYPLIGGVVVYFLMEYFLPGAKNLTGYRVFYNSYNSGIAVLTTGSFLKGILDIAGTSSPYVPLFFGAGYILIIVGLIILFVIVIRDQRIVKMYK